MNPTGIKIIRTRISRADLAAVAENQFGDMVKAVVDVQRRIMAIGGDLQADEESVLLEDGSVQSSLWGINLYHAEFGEGFVEFDSMINVRPAAGNRGRGVENEDVRVHIRDIMRELVSDA